MQSVCVTVELLLFHSPFSKNSLSLSQLLSCFIDPLSETVWCKMPIHPETANQMRQVHRALWTQTRTYGIFQWLSLSLSVSSEKRKLQVNILSPIHCSMNGRKCTVIVETKINQSQPDFTKSRSGYILSVPGN